MADLMRGTLTVRCEESGLSPRNGHHMKSGPTELVAL